MSESTDKPHLYLIDGSGYIFRAFFALPPMRRSDGLPTGAIYGFSRMLYRLLQDSSADYIGLVFDTSRISFRQDIYPEYKANRPEPPEDLVPQFPYFRKAGEALGLIPIEQNGYEADDLIASYAVQAHRQGMQVTILSSDKDLMQIVGGDIEMMDPIKNKRIGEQQVIEKFGVPPNKVIDVQALAGDSSDNVPGVPGIGIKTAAQLIEEYGSLQNLLDSAEQIKQPKRRQALLDNRALAETSLKLVTLVQDLSLPYDLEALKHKPTDIEVASAFFQEMEFKSLSANVAAGGQMSDADNKNNAHSHAVPLEKAFENYEILRNEQDLARWHKMIYDEGVLAFDTETTSLNPLQAELVGVSLALSEGRAAYIPLQHVQGEISEGESEGNKGEGDKGNKEKGDLFGAPASPASPSSPSSPALPAAELCPDQLPLQSALAWLKPLLADESLLKIGQNIKYDMAVLLNYDVPVAAYDDTMLMSFALSAGAGRHGMDDLSDFYFGYKPIKYEALAGKGKKQISFAAVAIKDAARYAAEDADITYRLWEVLSTELHAERLWAFYQRIERPLPPIVARMERHGIKVSPQKLDGLSNEFNTRLEGLESRIHSAAGRAFNPASPKQLGDLLFDELKLPGGKRTKSGAWSTDSDVLEELAETHDIAALVLEYRMLAKLINTYTKALKAQINPKTMRVHTQFMLTGAQTGRFSSTEPNLQNIPIRTQEGKEIRKAFIAEAGAQLLSFDYSQIELRIVAEVAEIESLRLAFKEDKDIHAMTAAEVFEVSLDKVTPDMRRQAKAINFGIIYGISSFGLARQLGSTRTQAQEFIDRYFARFPGIGTYMDKAKHEARENGYVETLFGRRIHIAGIADKNYNRRNYAERQAINAPIQGSAADIIKRAMIRMPQALAEADLSQVKMLLQVHDELIFEAPKDVIPAAKPIITEVMQSAHLPKCPLHVPLKVDCGIGDNWFSAH